MRMKEESLHMLVGALVFVIGAAFMIYAYASDASPGRNGEGMHLTARFGAVDGITIGSPVLLAGIPIGKVTAQELEAESKAAIVTIAITEDIDLPIDSVAQVVSDGVFGGKYIRIEPGAELDMLMDGDPFEFVQDSVIMEELLELIITRAEERRSVAKQTMQEVNETGVEQ
ncbi:MlaD family protein [Aestuariispira insulae]|uniref:Phospholipid/cholesterol/gamma-HCH transport system substrate-binding protein n=1 Tax=Aestuariispira insulae TaxID=1461337 RepID=A0A3D9HKC9_9PROT|nr:MlaD family protein [Aestuariispira insulae]RED49950.1 phospholipid/cholesterol/gamma-HCH transport system substrate-binding protein [Aestuariispira insulae]